MKLGAGYLDLEDTYPLQVSIEDHAIGTGDVPAATESGIVVVAPMEKLDDGGDSGSDP